MFERKAILISENKITNLDDNDNTRLVIFDLRMICLFIYPENTSK